LLVATMISSFCLHAIWYMNHFTNNCNNFCILKLLFFVCGGANRLIREVLILRPVWPYKPSILFIYTYIYQAFSVVSYSPIHREQTVHFGHNLSSERDSLTLTWPWTETKIHQVLYFIILFIFSRATLGNTADII